MEHNALIQNSIFELLKSNEIVVIPQFGAFVSDIESAKIQSFAVLPPTRQIIFNKNIVKDDGLLVQYVSEVLNQEYLKSKLIIAESVHGWKRSLTYGESINFDQIGELSLNNEGHVIFKASNTKDLQAEFFGLEKSNLKKLVKEEKKDLKITVKTIDKPIIKETLSEEKTIKSIEEKVNEDKTPAVKAAPKKVIPLYEEKKTFKWGVKSVAAAVSPFLFLGLGLIGAKSFDKQGDLNFASMFSWGEDKVEQVSNNEVDLKVQKINTAEDFFSQEELDLINGKQEAESAVESVSEKPAVIEQAEVHVQEIEDKDPVIESVSTTFKHHLVAGCFSSEANALKFFEELKSKGFNARLIGFTKTGLHRVAYGSYNSRKEALQNLASIKLNENKSCWILNEDI